MVKCLFLLVFSLSAPCLATVKAAKQEGQMWSQAKALHVFDHTKTIEAKDLLSQELQNQTFDAKAARKQVVQGNTPSSENLDFLLSTEVQRNQRQRHFHEDELFFKHAEDIFAGKKQDNKEVEEQAGYTFHTCQQAGVPFVMQVERTLHVHVQQEPAVKSIKCLGHHDIKEIKKKGDFDASIQELKQEFKEDPTILESDIQLVRIKSKTFIVAISWKHKSDATNCDHCKEKMIKPAQSFEVGDEWTYDKPDIWALAKSPHNTLIEQTCLDATPTKEINGRQVQKQCWKERLSFLYQWPETSDCYFLKQKNCEQIKQECVQQGPWGCEKWELTFRCLDSIKRYVIADGADLEIEEPEEQTYIPNQSFSEVAAKLAVFAEVKKQMEHSQLLDVTQLEIFKGKRMLCSKNVASDLMYDCCLRNSGLATQMHLTKCNAEELSLAEMNEQGLCYYVGSFEEKFLELWKSRDQHVFCCYPSKLARLVQEQGHQQLHLKWRAAEDEQCRGLTTEQLKELNFAKMDLSKLCEDFAKKLPDDMPERLQNFRLRLEQDIEKTEVKK